jgi:hypothetical protein
LKFLKVSKRKPLKLEYFVFVDSEDEQRNKTDVDNYPDEVCPDTLARVFHVRSEDGLHQGVDAERCSCE